MSAPGGVAAPPHFPTHSVQRGQVARACKGLFPCFQAPRSAQGLLPRLDVRPVWPDHFSQNSGLQMCLSRPVSCDWGHILLSCSVPHASLSFSFTPISSSSLFHPLEERPACFLGPTLPSLLSLARTSQSTHAHHSRPCRPMVHAPCRMLPMNGSKKK